MIAQVDLSLVLSAKLDRYLAGLALVHPSYVLRAFKELKPMMCDDVAISWLDFLSEYEPELCDLDEEKQHERSCALLAEFENGKYFVDVVSWMNSSSYDYDPAFLEDGDLSFKEYRPLSFTWKSIRQQHEFRVGLEHLQEYAGELAYG